jgi:DNA-binding NarL/FixJ family response regulator
VANSVDFTGRECQLIRGLLAGKSQKEIAFDLKLSPDTVKVYFCALYKKLGVDSQKQLIIWAYGHPEDIEFWI